MKNLQLLSAILALITLGQVVNSARILAFLPIVIRSHFLVFAPYLNELSSRGHDIVVVTCFPDLIRDQKVTKIIDLSKDVKIYTEVFSIDERPISSLAKAIEFLGFYGLVVKDTADLLRAPGVKKLVEDVGKDNKFDVVITELFFTDMFLPFTHNVPHIALSSAVPLPWHNARFANPDNPSYIPHGFGNAPSHMNFWQRLENTIFLIFYKFSYTLLVNPMTQRHADGVFGKHFDLAQMTVNTSLFLTNTHVSLNGVQPLVPAVVEVGGIHITPTKPLSLELQSFIDGAEHGVIYFCMGSMLKATTIPDDKRDALVKVFSRLPQRVLWKWEDDTMPGKSDNVKIVKWMPQRDILEHPNVKLFISHGGLLGTTEAVHCGVPIIGIPFYGDQAGNIEAVASHGAGLRLDYNDINEHNLYDKITQILNNPQYAENAKELSKRFRDRPQSPLETAVYWTEYVIRHKGAPHLRSAAVDLTWYQYLLLDVIAFLLLVAVTVSLLFYFTLKFLIKRLFAKSAPTNKTANKKVKKS
nr:UDP-glucuronosyltransferase [Nilaparvata lugens]